MEEDVVTLHIMKVNRFLNYVVCILVCLTTVSYFMGLEKAYVPVIIFIGAIISMLLSWQKKFIRWRSCVLVCIALVTLIFIKINPIVLIMLASNCACSIALYINKKLFIVFGIVLINFEVIFIQFSQHIYTPQLFIRSMISLEVNFTILFFLTKWGGELIKKVSDEADRRRELLNELDNTFEVIKASKASLEESIHECYTNAVRLNRKKNDISELLNELEEYITKQIRYDRKNNIDKEDSKKHTVLIRKVRTAVQEQAANIENLYVLIQNIKRLIDDLYIADVFERAKLFLSLRN